MTIDLREGPDYTVCISDEWSNEEKWVHLGEHFKRLGGIFKAIFTNASPEMSEGAYKGIDACLDQLFYYCVEFMYTWGCEQKAFNGRNGDYVNSFKLGYFVFNGIIMTMYSPEAYKLFRIDEVVEKTGQVFAAFMLRCSCLKSSVNVYELMRDNKISQDDVIIYDKTFSYRMMELFGMESLDWMDLSRNSSCMEQEEVKSAISAIKINMGMR